MTKDKGMKYKRKGKKIDQPNAETKRSKVSVVSPHKDIVPSPLADHVDATIPEPQSNTSRTAALGRQNKNETAEHLSGFIFMCNKNTKIECYQYRVFGLPLGKKEVVRGIKPGAKLFLFDFELKLLYGIYEATSTGKLNLEPAAFNGRFPAQVKFKIFKECFPIHESSLRHIIRENYTGSKFKQDLSGKQVENLSSSFRPLTTSSLSGPVPHAIPNASLSQAMPTGHLYMHAGSMPANKVPYVAATHRLRIPPSVAPQYDPKSNILAYGHSWTSSHVEHVNPSLDLQNLSRLCSYYVNVAKAQQPAIPEVAANGVQETSYSSYRTTEDRPPHDQITSLEMRYRNRTVEESASHDHRTNPEICYPTVDRTDPRANQITDFERQYYQPPVQANSTAMYQENFASYNPTAPSLYYTTTPSAVQPQVPSPYQPAPLPGGLPYQDSAVAYNPNPPAQAQPIQHFAPPVMYTDGYYATPSTSTQPQAEILQANGPVYSYYSYGTAN